MIRHVAEVSGRHKDLSATVTWRRFAGFPRSVALALEPGVDRRSHKFAYRAIPLTRDPSQTVELRLWKQDLYLFHVSSISMDARTDN